MTMFETDTFGNEIKIPMNTLWQYLEKEHLDSDNKLTQEQWEEFVDMYQNTFCGLCSEIGQELWEDFCEDYPDGLDTGVA